MKKICALWILLGCSTQTFAMFCPSNFNQINIGDTIDQVLLQCGKPDIQNTKKVDAAGPQEWRYYVTLPSTVNGAQQASVQMAIAFDQMKVINITVNAMSLASTSLCGGTISVGDTMESVKGVCGNPVFVNKSDIGESKPTEVTEFKYNASPAKLIFENGKLKERK